MGLIASSSLSSGQDSTKCYVCLTRSEAIAAADSALLGQSSVRRLKIAAAMFAAKAEEADELRSAIEVGQQEVYALRSAIEQEQRANDLWQTAYKQQKWKATRKTLGWFALAFIAGMIVSR